MNYSGDLLVKLIKEYSILSYRPILIQALLFINYFTHISVVFVSVKEKLPFKKPEP